MPRSSRFVAAMSLVGILATIAVAGDSTPLEARVDPRVELLSLIFRLAGNSEYNQPLSKSPYSAEVDEYFAQFSEHPVVALAKKLRENHGVSYDAVMSLAAHIEDTQGLKLRMPMDPRPARLDERWQPADVREFLEKARQFVQDTKFNDFFARHEKLFAATAERMTKKLGERPYVAWFDKFFGRRATARFCVYIGMLNGPCNYGVSVDFADGRAEITPVIGAYEFDADGIPVFSDRNVPTIVHEFCHSYTNPIVDRHADELHSAGERIFQHCEDAMRQQAYGNWLTMMRESFVRACVVRNLATTDGAAAAQKDIEANRQRGFQWIGQFADVLAQYEAQRDRYPDFDAFMPRAVEFFDTYAKQYEQEAQELAKRAPHIVQMVPANGATDVDPNLKEIRVTFDRPMRDKSWAVVGGGPHFPELPDKPRYEEGRTVFVCPVTLKPGWSYQFWLNRGQYSSFRSEEGAALESVEVNFTTRE